MSYRKSKNQGFGMIEMIITIALLLSLIMAASQMLVTDQKVVGLVDAQMRAQFASQSVADTLASMTETEFYAFMTGAPTTAAGDYYDLSKPATAPAWAAEWLAQAGNAKAMRVKIFVKDPTKAPGADTVTFPGTAFSAPYDTAKGLNAKERDIQVETDGTNSTNGIIFTKVAYKTLPPAVCP